MTQQLPPLHLACLEDEMRPNFSLIELKNNIATATNGSILVKCDLSKTSNIEPEFIQKLDGKFIHFQVWKELYKCDSFEILEDQINCSKNGIVKTFYYSNPQGEFFKTNSIILDIKEGGESDKRYSIYSPKLISILHKIFQHETMIFSFSSENHGDIVFPFEDSGIFAVLMPAYSEQKPNRYFFI
jgi:hypothetical protein